MRHGVPGLEEDGMRIGVDFDGTLARQDDIDAGGYDPGRVGEPVPAMVERVRRWLARGDEVVVLTARVHPSHEEEAAVSKAAIEAFCLEQFGRTLQVTCMKDSRMDELWDDKAVRVVRNEGMVGAYVEKVDGDPLGEFLAI